MYQVVIGDRLLLVGAMQMRMKAGALLDARLVSRKMFLAKMEIFLCCFVDAVPIAVT